MTRFLIPKIKIRSENYSDTQLRPDFSPIWLSYESAYNWSDFTVSPPAKIARFKPDRYYRITIWKCLNTRPLLRDELGPSYQGISRPFEVGWLSPVKRIRWWGIRRRYIKEVVAEKILGYALPASFRGENWGIQISARPGATGLVLTTFDFIYQYEAGEIKWRMNGLGQEMLNGKKREYNWMYRNFYNLLRI